METNKSQGRTIGKLFNVASTIMVEIESNTYHLAECYSPRSKHMSTNGQLEANANAAHIVKCVNNFYAMKGYIEDMAMRYAKSEWISGEANKILDNLK